MGLIRTDRSTGDFFLSHKGWAENDELTWEARGLLAYLFTKPDDWEVRMKDLIHSGPCKIHKLRRVMKELEEAGYVDRTKQRRDDGTFEWVSVVYEEPPPKESGVDGPPPPTSSSMESVQSGEDRGYSNNNSSTKNNKEGSSGCARARMPEQLTTVYSTYEEIVDEWLNRLEGPAQADRLVMQCWGQSGIGSATMRLARKYSWPLFVTGVVITEHEAEHPNARYLDTLLEALSTFEANDRDYRDAETEEAESDLERLWRAAQSA